MRTLALASVILSSVGCAGALGAQQPAPAAAPQALAEAKQFAGAGKVDAARAAAERAIEADPDCIEAHDLLRNVAWRQQRAAPDKSKELAAALRREYEAWAGRFPGSFGVQYGLGMVYAADEDPRARPFLLAAVQRNPALADAWQSLSIDAERWGDQEKAREYMARAAAAAPDSPDFAFYAANHLFPVDRAKWVAASLEVARRFPRTERGAQALYWLGARATSDKERIAFWEQERAEFPPEQFDWSESAMGLLFEAYLRTDPARALALATDLEKKLTGRSAGEWQQNHALAESWLAVEERLAAGDFAQAAPMVDKLRLDRRSANAGQLELLKAKVAAGSGNVQAAFDLLAARQATTPEDLVRTALTGYGRTLGMSAEQVDAEVCRRRDAQAKPAPAFELGRYGADGKATLADYRGKVVLLTFWFPGCGPCRGEFPFFEHVLARFRGRNVAYVGINVVPGQDDYVQPFMAGTKYTFTPLRGGDAVMKAFGVRGCPTNFLIDQEGRIAYRNFRIAGDNEVLLQRMIESLLDHPPAAADK